MLMMLPLNKNFKYPLKQTARSPQAIPVACAALRGPHWCPQPPSITPSPSVVEAKEQHYIFITRRSAVEASLWGQADGANTARHCLRSCKPSKLFGEKKPKSLNNPDLWKKKKKKAILLQAWCKEQLKYGLKQRGAAAGLGGGALPSMMTQAACCMVGLNNSAPGAALTTGPTSVRTAKPCGAAVVAGQEQGCERADKLGTRELIATVKSGAGAKICQLKGGRETTLSFADVARAKLQTQHWCCDFTHRDSRHANPWFYRS